MGGGSVSALARQSVSKLLSAQLNRLAGDLIAGVDLNFDLESSEDYSTGQKVDRTDLNVGLSKSLLNDRIRVNVGSSFGLEGQETRGKASRSEEHTSELQSLMRSSYAVFCVKKTKKIT